MAMSKRPRSRGEITSSAPSRINSGRLHHLFTVKDNQPTLKADIAGLHGEAFPPQDATTNKAHGRAETRRIGVSDTLNGYVTFPHAAQVACVEGEIFHLCPQKRTLERVCLITGPNRTQASPAQLLAQNRGHWAIENRSPAWATSPSVCCVSKVAHVIMQTLCAGMDSAAYLVSVG